MAHVGDLFMGLLPGCAVRDWARVCCGNRWRGGRVWLSAHRACVFATNTRAAALYRKAGFVEEGTTRAILIDGVFHDDHHGAL